MEEKEKEEMIMQDNINDDELMPSLGGAVRKLS
jgi:hypothetical protein